MTSPEGEGAAILLVVEDAERTALVRGQLSMVLPRAVVEKIDASAIAEAPLAAADAGLIDGGSAARNTADLLRVLRARGFDGPIVVISPMLDDADLRATTESLGMTCVARARTDDAPAELAAALARAITADGRTVAALRQARRVFAAGQVALSLQHAINNPLAALMAEAQLLQMEELNAEQRGAVERMIELCRRLVILTRRLDALAEG